mgnify:CR=1 FL=1
MNNQNKEKIVLEDYESEFLYKKNVLVVRGSFRPATLVNQDMIKSSWEQFRDEADIDARSSVLLTEITMGNLCLNGELDEKDFLRFCKKALKTACIRHTSLTGKEVKKIAFCGGSGSFLLPHAKAANADVYITGDFKYHEFFDADEKILIADVGHFESEQFTIELLADYLMEKFPTFAVLKTGVNTNPIAYV